MSRNEHKSRYGSLIRLKPEYEERYIILHKYTFPGVLRRIRDSGIRNYSIFLLNGLLFAYFEYTGSDFTGDMRLMGEDPATRDWWKLTDPMQNPLEGRKPGDWWFDLPEVLQLNGKTAPRPETPRTAYRISCTGGEISAPSPAWLKEAGLRALAVFRYESSLFGYFEHENPDSVKDRTHGQEESGKLLRGLFPGNPEWTEMRPVFHTD